MSIYRKYRPKTFAEMVGQQHIKLTLQNELETDSIVHAYLFCGPRGLGKTTAARLFAKSVNCDNRKKGQSEPCNKCSSCTDIMESKALDIVEIDAASNTGVDNVRENVIENARFSPTKMKYKVFIIDEVHMLSISAFNALLKTLEEPPAHTIFILCTTELHKVPETIISRCQRFDFKKVNETEAVKRLKNIAESEGVKIEDEVFSVIAVKSEGCMRDAEGLLGQVLSLGGKKITREQAALVLPSSEAGMIFDLIELLVHNNVNEAIDFINNLVEEGVDLEVFNKEMLEFLRKLVLIKLGVSKAGILNFKSEDDKRALRLTEVMEVKKIIEMIELFLKAGKELKTAVIPQLPMELAVFKLCQAELDSGDIINPKPAPAPFRNPVAVSVEPSKPVKPAGEVNTPRSVNIVNTVEADEEEESGGNINLDRLKEKWTDIVKAGHKKSRDLTFINEKMVYPVKINGNLVEIGFKYELHQSRFEANSNKDKFEQALKEVVGEKLVVKSKTLKPSELAEIDIAKAADEDKKTKMTGTKVTEDNILDEVMNSFGGQIVE